MARHARAFALPLGLEPRLLIAYRVTDTRVDIVRIINGAREIGRVMRN